MNKIVSLNLIDNELPRYIGNSRYDLIITKGIFAVGINRRSLDDPHIVFYLLGEDDGCIFETTHTQCYSSHWLELYAFFLLEVNYYLNNNYKKDKLGGYEFND
jgi:hypothetical protein